MFLGTRHLRHLGQKMVVGVDFCRIGGMNTHGIITIRRE